MNQCQKLADMMLKIPAARYAQFAFQLSETMRPFSQEE
jgi:hypothetical protein